MVVDGLYSFTSFGSWVRAQRRLLDITQQQLADAVGCSPITVRKLEAGERKPSRQLAELLADYLGASEQDRAALLYMARGVSPGTARTSTSPAVARLPHPAHSAATPHSSSRTSPVHNLPQQITTLIGREAEVADLKAQLLDEKVRLLTITGPPGIGKTRVALQVAWEMLGCIQGEGAIESGCFPDSVFFVALSSVPDPNLVAPTIAGELGIKSPGRRVALPPVLSTLVALKEYLRDKKLLLVLDNFEHVIKAEPLLVELLADCPGVKILVTSREPLHVHGEHLLILPPLRLPDLEHLPSYSQMPSFSSVALLLERAREVKPDFTITEDNAAAVAAICNKMDGVPLALELVAARFDIFSPRALMHRLEEPGGREALRLLSGSTRDFPASFRTLPEALDWSYRLLTAGEQTLFTRLSVFVGGFTIMAAEAVCNAVGDLPLDVLEGISSLLSKNLLRREPDSTTDDESRFSMLETIREYAGERLEASGSVEKVRRWHAEYCLALAQSAEMHLRGAEQNRWLDTLDREHANMRSVLAWAVECGDIETAARLCGELVRFWVLRGHLTEGRRWLEQVLAHDTGLPPDLRATALGGAATLAMRQGDYSQAAVRFSESLDLRRALNDTYGIANALNDLGLVADYQGDLDRAEALYRESLELFRRSGHEWNVANTLNNVATVTQRRGDLQSARSLYQEALTLWKALGDKWGIAGALANLAILARHDDDYERAVILGEEALALFRQTGNRHNAAMCLNNLGKVAELRGDTELAVALYMESLDLQREVGDKHGTAMILGRLGDLMLEQGSVDRAGRLYSAALDLLRESGDREGMAYSLAGLAAVAAKQEGPDGAMRAARLFGSAKALWASTGTPLNHADTAAYEEHMAAARGYLGEERFAALCEEGAAMDVPEAAAYALREGA